MRPIDADKIRYYSYDVPSLNKRRKRRIVIAFYHDIKKIPTINPRDEEQADGSWIVHKTATGREYTTCSSCGIDFKFQTDRGTFAFLDMRGCDFCPSCGKKMGVSE